MANWLKRKMEQLSAKLNTDDEPLLPVNTDRINIKAADKPAVSSIKVDNIEELKEITIGAITNAAGMLGHGNAAVAGLVFHSRFADNAIENIGLQTLIKDADFIKQIKRTFKAKGISYKDNLSVEAIHGSANVDKVTQITNGIGVEVMIPGESLRKIRASVIATEGFTWEPEYTLEPTGKNYFIGRCKDPKIENGPKIHNDIAFIGIEEVNEEKYKINNYISRANANIIFDKELGAYKIYRSKFLNNPAHKIKIYNTTQNDFSGITLSNAAVPHVLKHGDSICFNDKVVLEFYLLND
ncbi:MAG: hypothetical protein QM640_11295 [Niabella sp.]